MEKKRKKKKTVKLRSSENRTYRRSVEKYEIKKDKEKTGIKSSQEKSIKRRRRNKLELQSSYFFCLDSRGVSKIWKKFGET